MRALIYAFRSPGSGATYIGKHQCDPEGWPRRGTGCLPDGYRGSGVVVGHFHRRHGAAVQWRILAVVDGDRDAVNAAERRAIRLARVVLGRKCVNQTGGGDGFTSADSRAMHSDPAFKARHTAATKAAHSRPEVIAKMTAVNRETLSRPDVQSKISAAKKAQWSDPESRAKISAAQNSPEVKARHSATNKARAATAEGRAFLASIRKSATTPEAIAKMLATRIKNKARRAAEQESKNG